MATASADQTARLWDVSLDSVVARICSLAPAITATEWDHYLPGLEMMRSLTSEVHLDPTTHGTTVQLRAALTEPTIAS